MNIAVSVSGFLADSDSYELAPEDPKPGAQEFMAELQKRGHWLIIHDWRANEHNKFTALKNWLFRNGVDFGEIWVSSGKPNADVVLDGLAPGAITDFTTLLQEIG
jgi:hypothetical protein